MIKIFIIQDTSQQVNIFRQDSIKPLADSSTNIKKESGDSARLKKAVIEIPVAKAEPADTTSCCFRNSIADITFYDSANFITRIDTSLLHNFPFVITEINRKHYEETKAAVVRHLKRGNEIPTEPFHNDWVLPVILLSAFIYGIIKAESGKFFKGIIKHILFRGINESASRDIGGLFQWQSTLLNLASFINISIFAFFTALWYNVIPFEGRQLVSWLTILVIVISTVTIRHFVCIVTGNLSGEKEIFREYLIGIYQAYRLMGLLLLALTILILFTTLLPVNALFFTGFCMVAISYFIRAFRLFLIFINRHVSIFYLILYLCALEILPVLIIVKYVTGLV
jgi:hypothetical protein